MNVLKITSRSTKFHPRVRGGFAIAVALWAVGIATLMLVAVQTAAWKQAASGREALARVRATWAARAGVEVMIARLQSETLQSSPTGPVELLRTLQSESEGTLDGANFRVIHGEAGNAVLGPADAHAKLNINTLTQDDLMLLPNMTEDIAACILDYLDADDEIRDGGAESETYMSMSSPYNARNGPIRSLDELLLVYNMTPELLRGADESFDGIIDQDEAARAPAPLPTGSTSTLDTTTFGWSPILTASSVSPGYGTTGQKLIDLTNANPGEVASIANIDNAQAEVIIAYAASGTVRMENFITTDLSAIANTLNQALGQTGNNARYRNIRNLDRDQMKRVYECCTIGLTAGMLPGKINLNTVPEEVLSYLATVDAATADVLKQARDNASGNLESVIDLLDSGFTRQQVGALANVFTTRSTVFEFTAVGRDQYSGLTVEMQVRLDRSTVPITITMTRIR